MADYTFDWEQKKEEICEHSFSPRKSMFAPPEKKWTLVDYLETFAAFVVLLLMFVLLFYELGV